MQWWQDWRSKIAGCVLIFTAVLLLPVHIPATTFEENPEGGTSFEVSSDQKLLQPLTAQDGNLSGILFWTRQPSAGQLESEIVLTLAREATLEPVYTARARLADVFDEEANYIRFTFWPRRLAPGEKLIAVLEMPGIDVARPLVLRPAIVEPAHNKVAFRTLTLQPLAGAFLRVVYAHYTEGQDITYYWHRGALIARGENPYSCVRDHSCQDQKNPGHFPLFYWLSAAVQRAGLSDYGSWIAVWRPVLLLFYVGVAALIFVPLYREGYATLAFFGAFFWLFNRWSLYVVRVAQIDFVALFFLVLSVLLLPRRFWLAVVLFSVSLAFKQVAIFMGPLYLLYAWQRKGEGKLRNVVLAGAVSASVPLLALLPFVINDAPAVAQGLFFSLTRNATVEAGTASLDAFLGVSGSIGALPMLVLMCLIYLVAWRRALPLPVSALLIFLTFVGFNHVLFNQYFVWALPFAPLTTAEVVRLLQSRSDKGAVAPAAE